MNGVKKSRYSFFFVVRLWCWWWWWWKQWNEWKIENEKSKIHPKCCCCCWSILIIVPVWIITINLKFSFFFFFWWPSYCCLWICLAESVRLLYIKVFLFFCNFWLLQTKKSKKWMNEKSISFTWNRIVVLFQLK